MYLSIFGSSINFFFAEFLYKQNDVNLFEIYGHDCGLKAAS